MVRRALGDAVFGYMRFRGWLSAGIALLICAGFIIGGLVSLFNALNFYIEAEAADGRVVEIVEINSPTDKGVDRFYYAARIAFTTAAGQQVTWQESDIDEAAPYKVGDSVSLLYAPDDPQDVRISGIDGLFGLTLTYLGIGFGLLFVFMPRLFLLPFGDLSEAKVNLIVSGALCLLGLGLAAHTWLYTLQTRVVEGAVAQMIELRLQDEQKADYKTYRPRVVFRAEDGTTYSFKLNRALRAPRYKVGDTVTVRYPLDDPAAAALENSSTLWFPAAAAIGGGLLYLVLSFGVDLFHRALAWIFYGGRKRRPPPPAPAYPPVAAKSYRPVTVQSWSPQRASEAAPIEPNARAAAETQRFRELRSQATPAATRPEPARDPLMQRILRRSFSGYITGREKISAFLGLTASGAVLVLAMVELFTALDFYAAAEAAEGRVVERMEHVRQHDQYDEYRYTSRIAFTTAQGEAMTWTTDESDRPIFAVGQTVPLLYRSSDPTDIRPDDIDGIFGLPLAGLVLGSCMLLVLVPQAIYGLFGDFSRVSMTLMTSGIVAAVGVTMIWQGALAGLTTQVVQGQVTEIIALDRIDSQNKPYTTYRPRVAFKADSGAMLEIDLGRAPRAERYKIGDVVPIAYPDGNPGAAYLHRNDDSWFTGALVIALAGFHLLFSLGLELIRRVFSRIFASGSQAEYG